MPQLDGAARVMDPVMEAILPMFMFLVLFVTFCKVDFHKMRPVGWHLWVSIFNLLFVGIVMGLILGLRMKGDKLVLMEALLMCIIAPCATAAAVVTTRLHGNANVVVSYTCLINMAVSLVVPAMVPFLHESNVPGMTFEISFLLILAKVFPLLMMPLVVAWFVRHLFPKFHAFILRQPNLAFNLWAVSLSLAIGVSVKALVHSEESLGTLLGIAVASFICCVVQFGLGRLIGRKYGEPVAGTQSLGQKNTVFAIWMGYTFLNPVTALAGGFYSIWHNVVNSVQLWKIEN